MKPTSLTSALIKQAQRDIRLFLKDLATEYECRWYPADAVSKKGVGAYSDSVVMNLFIRTAEEARGSDLILGIVLTGSHVAIATTDHAFAVGDHIVSSDYRYQVKSVTKKTGAIYTVLDIERTDTRDIGDRSL
jgi:hypothetical protein